MAIVLEARNGKGNLVGRCNAKCHTATGKKCKCICYGANHGVGLAQAIWNSGTMQGKWSPGIKWEVPLRRVGDFIPGKDAAPL